MATSGQPATPPVECTDCVQSPKVQPLEQQDDGLKLGSCSKLYQDWKECIEESNGQVTSCTEQLKRFRACHSALQANQIQQR
eukprot:6205146-Pleurochrysis_carterae.AAC.1